MSGIYTVHSVEDQLVSFNGFYARMTSGEEIDHPNPDDDRTVVARGSNHQRTFAKVVFSDGATDVRPIIRDTVNVVGIPSRRTKRPEEYPSGVPEELIA